MRRIARGVASGFLRCFAAAAAIAAAPAAAQETRPIPEAGAWQMVDHVPGVEGRVCTVRVDGPGADTMLLLNNQHLPVLMAGHRDWHDLSGEADVSLSIDGRTPIRLKAYMVVNLVMMAVEDAELLQLLRDARTLDWTFPFGRYRAEVTGLGRALDAMTACERAR